MNHVVRLATALVTAFASVALMAAAAIAFTPGSFPPRADRAGADDGGTTNGAHNGGAVLVQAEPVRFRTIDVYVDTGGKPLAAYQVSLRASDRNALLSGLEGGEHPAFARPPYYDPKALIDETVIVAGLSTADELPRGRTRVARLHVQVTGPADPRYEATLHVAAAADGAALDAKVTVDAAK